MRRNKRGQRGIVLVAVCLCLLLMLGGLGLGVDLNRLLAARSSFGAGAEAAALGAVLELDGTAAGLARARLRAADLWQRQGLDPAARFTLEFSASPAGPWSTNPPSTAAADVKFARVAASSTLPLTLMRTVVSERSLPVDIAAVAGQSEMKRVETGLLPLVGQAGGEILDGLTVTPEPGNVRGTILRGMALPVKMGDRLERHQGTRQAERAVLREIVSSDRDTTSANYADYARNGQGNGRRLILLPLTDATTQRVIRFAAFFLLPAEAYSDEAPTLHAELAGGYLAGSHRRAVSGEGAWQAEVVR